MVDLYQQLVHQHREVAEMAALVAEAEVVIPLMTEMAPLDKDLMVELLLVHLLEAAAVVPLNKAVLAEINLALAVEEKI